MVASRRGGSEVAAPRLVAERRTRGLTQVELGELAGVAHETISRIEQGRSRPSLRTLEKLARALGLEVRDLLDPGSKGKRLDEAPRSPELRRLLEILPRLDDPAIRHLLGIARLLLKKQIH